MGPLSHGTVFRWAVAATGGVVAVLLAVLAVWTVRDVLVLALVAMFIAVSLDPAVRWLVRHRVRRAFAVTLMVLFASAIVGLVMVLIIPPMVNEASQISKDIPAYVADLDQRSKTFRELSARYGIDKQLNAIAADLPARISTSAIGFFRRFLGVLASTLLVLVLAIYFMADLPRIRRSIPNAFPASMRERTRRIVDVVFDKVGSYMIGGITVSFIASLVAYIGLTLLSVPFALPLAMLVFITAFIPLIGATLGSVICVIVAAIANGIWPNAVFVLLLFVVYQQLENYIIAPRIMQRTVNLPAVGVLLAGLVGGTLLGLVGALMAIPVAAAVKAILVEVKETSGPPPAQRSAEDPPRAPDSPGDQLA